MENAIGRKLGAFFAREGEGVHAAYLFGSHAEGREHRESDIDVGVLLDRSAHPTREARGEVQITLTSALVAALHCNDVQVLVLNDAPPGLGRHIVTRGLQVYVADPAAEHAYVRDVQLRAADLAPFLEKMRRLKLEALRS